MLTFQTEPMKAIDWPGSMWKCASPQLPIISEVILTALHATLEPLLYIHAMWEGEAAA